MKRRKRMLLLALLGGLLLLASCATKQASYTGANETMQSLFELGLVGDGAQLEANRELTYAEAAMLAARAHADIHRETIAKSLGKWYTPYLNYAKKHGLIDEIPDNPERPVLRYEAAEMLAAVSEPAEINDIRAIPDTAGTTYDAAILKLYRAGLTLGTDSRGNFLPGGRLTATQVAEWYLRLFGKQPCLTGTLDRVTEDDAYNLVINSSWNAVKEGLSSGWTLDNRGGVPRNSLTGGYGTLIDISTEAGTALIRHLNRTETGTLSLFARVETDGADGAYLEFRNEADASVWQLMTMDGAWQYRQADGSYVRLTDLTAEQFDIRAEIDLDNVRTTISVNGETLGTWPLAVEPADCNVFNFRFATTEAGTPTLVPIAIRIDANYALNETLTYLTDEKLPDWTLNAAKADALGGVLTLSANGEASVSFDPVPGKAVAEYWMFYCRDGATQCTIESAGNPIVKITSSETGFALNDTRVYPCIYDQLWYRFRLEFDFAAQTVHLKINGREVATAPFTAYTTSIDRLTLQNPGKTDASFDNFKVFRTFERDDYVPEPVVPDKQTDYLVGMNVCSLWRNGAHFGWSCVSPYEDPQPVLGYYDEGNPETADWEIKYIVEHGVDFQAFCVYMDSTDAPQRPATEHLYNGFMNAKYSDLTKFCVIWECQNAGSPTSMEEWKTNYVPYMIENFLKDPRHVTIDNQLLLCVFGSDSLAARLGGAEQVKAAFAYLEDEVRKLGFDGMIYLACSTRTSRELADMGFDGCYAYNWGTDGYQLSYTQQSILNSARQQKRGVYTVPTISVGFNSLPWHGVRYPMMSMDDYAEAQEWVKTEYLPTYAEESWQKQLVMLSTWNEYGEGTYLMPTTDEKGFGYLDVLREAYTTASADASLNVVPTDAQRARINRLYPQYLHLLRQNGEEHTPIDTSELEPVRTIDLRNESASRLNGIRNASQTAEGLTGETETDDASIVFNNIEELSLPDVQYIRIRARLKPGTALQIFYTTNTDSEWNERKSATFAAAEAEEWVDYYLSTARLERFFGKLTAFRLDPGKTAGQSFAIQSIDFLQLNPTGQLSDTILVDTNPLTLTIRPMVKADGECYVAFEPAAGLDFALGCYHEWDADEQRLTLSTVRHTLTCQVGSDTYELDGAEKTWSSPLESVRGLPLLPIEQLCRALELSYALNGDTVCIQTDAFAYYEALNREAVPGQWEFETMLDTEGWKSYNMSLTVRDGYLACKTTTNDRDPILSYGETLNLSATAFTDFECRVRYRYSGEAQSITVYFTTDADGSMDETKTIRIPLKSSDSGGAWETYQIDLTQLPQWNGVIRELRFDPFNADGQMEIDYLRFIPKNEP